MIFLASEFGLSIGKKPAFPAPTVNLKTLKVSRIARAKFCQMRSAVMRAARGTTGYSDWSNPATRMSA